MNIQLTPKNVYTKRSSSSKHWEITLKMFLGMLHKHRKCYPCFYVHGLMNHRSWSDFQYAWKNRSAISGTWRYDYLHFLALKMYASHTCNALAIPFDHEKDKLCVLWHVVITRDKKTKASWIRNWTFSHLAVLARGTNSCMRITTVFRHVVKPFRRQAVIIFTEINGKMFLVTKLHENYDRQ